MRDFRKYEVWQLSHQLTLKIYKVSESFPKSEIFGLTSQLRRASYSIGLNVAEGSGRISESEFRRFLGIAYGSANEVEYITLLIKDLQYISDESFNELSEMIVRIKMMLRKLINKLKDNNSDLR